MATSTVFGQWTQPIAATGHSLGAMGISGWASKAALQVFSTSRTGGELQAVTIQKFMAVAGSFDFDHGQTLLQVSQAGESARDAALMLATILNREDAQRARMKEFFDGKPKREASEEFDLPHADAE